MIQKGYSLDGDTLVINRGLTELDLFVKSFLEILKDHSDYLIVSGFVSISTGRTRGTEDIDILVPAMDKEKFGKLFDDLHKRGFWCYQGDTIEEAYPYIESMSNIRFARVDEMLPNVEFIPIDRTKKAKYFEFMHPQKIKVGDFEFKIPPIEFEILYKEIILKGKKDLEDAQHLRIFFSELLKKERFKEYEGIIRDELR